MEIIQKYLGSLKDSDVSHIATHGPNPIDVREIKKLGHEGSSNQIFISTSHAAESLVAERPDNGVEV